MHQKIHERSTYVWNRELSLKVIKAYDLWHLTYQCNALPTKQSRNSEEGHFLSSLVMFVPGLNLWCLLIQSLYDKAAEVYGIRKAHYYSNGFFNTWIIRTIMKKSHFVPAHNTLMYGDVVQVLTVLHRQVNYLDIKLVFWVLDVDIHFKLFNKEQIERS